MSDVAKGASRVGSVMTKLSRLDYRCARVASSGQRKGSRKKELGIAGDIIALAPADTGLPHLIVEVGGEKKIVMRALEEIYRHPLPPGFIGLVARVIDRRWRFHTRDGPASTDLLAAIRFGSA